SRDKDEADRLHISAINRGHVSFLAVPVPLVQVCRSLSCIMALFFPGICADVLCLGDGAAQGGKSTGRT
ncbi:hypothetical protein AB9F41_38005, partial [Rhizobium leguminosarum]|uniref:hypothetical protein n=1 Tax=Rhizobium leguminosarum TaxID=384 RepID=UPI003F9AF0F7